MRWFVLTALCSLTLAAQTPVADAGWNFADPNATLVGSIRPQALLSSPMITTMLEQAAKASGDAIGEASAGANGGTPNAAPDAAMMTMGVQMVRAMLGEVSEIRFAVVSPSPDQFEVVAVVLGTMDEQMLGMMTQGQATLRRINPTTLLIGNGPALEQAAARMARSAAGLRPNALQNVTSISDSDLWLAGSLPDSPMTAELKDKLRALALGLSFHENLDLELDLTAATPAMAEELVREANAAESQQPPEFRGKIQSFVEGSTARFRASLPPELLMQAATALPIPGMPGGDSGADPDRPTPLAPPVLIDPNSAPPAPPQRRTIVIQGAEGTKEIPLEPAH